MTITLKLLLLVLDIIASDVKSRILGFSLSTVKPQRNIKSVNISSPIKTRRLQPSANEDNHATILVDGSNFHGITAMDTHPSRFLHIFLFQFVNVFRILNPIDENADHLF